jgi:cytochrome c-type biogenesis protein CcmH
MLWLIFVALTCAAALAVLLPLAVSSTKQLSEDIDEAIYRTAVSDIERNHKWGLVGSDEVSSLKAEVARRLLRAKECQSGPAQEDNARTLAALVACFFIPILSVSLYLHLGRHDLADQPLQTRIAAIPGHKDATKRIRELEALLHKRPRDGRAYELIVPYYQRERRFDDAIHALEAALRLLGALASRFASLGEAKVVAAQGEVPPEALTDFEAALKLDPKDILAHYYLGVAAAQSGDKEKARTIWSRMLADAPKGAEWIKQVEEDLRELNTTGRQ